MKIKKSKSSDKKTIKYDAVVYSKARLIPAVCFVVSALIYGYILLNQDKVDMHGHAAMPLFMIVLDIAAAYYIVQRKIRFDRGEFAHEVPVPSRATVISRQKLMCFVVTVAACVQITAIFASYAAGITVLFIVPILELCAAAVCLDYFKYEIEDIGFPMVAIGLSFALLTMTTRFNHMCTNIWMYAVGFCILGFAGWAVVQGEAFLKAEYNRLGIALAAGFVIVISAYINTGVNFITLDQGHMVTLTVEDKEYESRTRYREETSCLYVSSDDGHYYWEDVEVYMDTFDSVSVGDKVELKECRSIFNVRSLTDPGVFERDAEVNLVKKLGSTSRADMLVITVGILFGIAFAVASLAGLGLMLFLLVGGLAFLAAAVWCFISGEPAWVWCILGFFSGLCLYVVVDTLR